MKLSLATVKMYSTGISTSHGAGSTKIDLKSVAYTRWRLHRPLPWLRFAAHSPICHIK